MSNANHKITVENVTRRFMGSAGEVVALDQTNLTIAEGEFVTVVGPSGCGKTTLLNMIAGLDEPSSGRILLDGQEVHGPSPERGVIFQQYALFPWLTVEQNVAFGLKLKGVPAAQRADTVSHYLKLVGLSDFRKALPKELSGGMKQRCAIARAYAMNPSLLLMDEPFGALDAQTRVQLQAQLLETWEQERKTVFFITHDVDEAVFLARRVIVMSRRPGRVLMEVQVDLPYPRTPEIRLSDEFAHIRNQVWKGVYQQILGNADPA